ncbi:DsbA family oxidoreductase [Arthrobacter crystallopoietes]|uniref:Predicted dithiol-disulfide isomerase, DsbA family n=1 Tax=Crystallibacter crystallopoietes TaxID=37928 RepID=A0A1H1AKY9_9MICC|nr:DsbA family protein [Arthrobacter crystallopoietes]AUI51490.1 dithiol-disulfide isomerase [Arthrobacter crystallopoietes]SDQ40365.1 Predicted dithiol-disulfide isomerase, DsbA family [Arthrobacter crystallopoietes]
MARPNVPPNTVTVFTDVMCGWSTLALHRFYQARDAAGLTGRLHVDLQLFLLEDLNRTALTTRMIEPEKSAINALAPELEFKQWQRDPYEWPVTSLPANEAVHAAKEQSLAAAEELDMALRLAFWRDSRCISMRHEILDVATACSAVDVDRLRDAFDTGRARGPMMQSYFAHRDEVQGSPHFFLADGTDVANPGMELHQEDQDGAEVPVVDDDEPGVYDGLVRHAAAAGVG